MSELPFDTLIKNTELEFVVFRDRYNAFGGPGYVAIGAWEGSLNDKRGWLKYLNGSDFIAAMDLGDSNHVSLDDIVDVINCEYSWYIARSVINERANRNEIHIGTGLYPHEAIKEATDKYLNNVKELLSKRNTHENH